MLLSRVDEEYDSDPLTSSFATSSSTTGVGSSGVGSSSSSKQKKITESDESDSGIKRKRDDEKSSKTTITTPKKRKVDSEDEEKSSTKRVTRSSSSKSSEKQSDSKPMRRMIDKKRSKKIQADEIDEDDSDDQGEDEYEVEAILLKKTKKNREACYLVKWKHWSIKDCSWEPRAHLEKLEEMLEKFEKEIYPQFSTDYKRGKCQFVHEKVVNSRKVKNATEYLVQWKDYPINTWEPENEVPFKFISRYNKSTTSYKKVVVSKSSSSSKDTASDNNTTIHSDEDETSSTRSSSSKKNITIEPEDNDIEIPPPPQPSQPTQSSSSTPKNRQSKNKSFISEKELAEMDFDIIKIKKRHNTIQFVVRDNQNDETHTTDVNCLRGKATVQKLVDFLLGKVVFEKK